MPRNITPLTHGAALLVALVLAAPLSAQEERRERGRTDTGVFRMEIFNGATQTVRYFGDGLSASERGTLRDAEMTENETLLARDLLALKQLYITSERILEPYRRQVQQMQYGLETTTTDFAAASWAPWGNSGYSVYNLPYVYPNPTLPVPGAVAGAGATVSRSLAYGVGDEGRIKEALARTLAVQATPEHLNVMREARSSVVARAASSPALREVLGPSGARPRGDGVRPAAGEIGEDGAVVTLKSGDRVRGTKVEEGKEWVIVHTTGGRQIKVRQSEVVRIDLPGKEAGKDR